ncbi:MAG: NAD(P)H-hydrate dehydratase [Deltaproteobacteria bacterium]|nr:MAG: NAD(P)H-hydrate dehydratase [Deltaproteobacteria bacterium]
MKVATARQMAELDRVTIHTYGIPSLVLMENAGRSCTDRIFRILEEKVGAPQEASVAVVCGKGNNGGDGMVIARHLHNRGVYVEVFLLGETAELSADAKTQHDILRRMDVEIRVVRDTEGVEDLRTYLEEVHLCVDAILGTGLSSPLEGTIRDVVEVVNLSMATVFAVDLPSGIDATTGRILGEAIRADYTGTFGLLKLGHVLLPGSIHCGETEIYDIGIPSRAVFDAEIKTEALDEQIVKSMLSVRPPDFHKGDAGRVYIVGGSPGMTGAPCLAGLAALRMGAGLITVVTPASLRPIVESKQMEVMCAGIRDDGTGYFSPAMIPELLEVVSKADVLVIGPGMGANGSMPEFLKELLPKIKVPFLLDADALNALAGQASLLQSAGAPCIVTPHPGEMSRLTRESIESIEMSRLDSARHLAEEERVTVILKGARTVVATPKGDLFINTTGNPYMASGGMGDALAGMVAALASQGLSPTDAACAGVFLHGMSADLLVREHPMTPVTATDVIGNIPGALQHTLGETPPEE